MATDNVFEERIRSCSSIGPEARARGRSAVFGGVEQTPQNVFVAARGRAATCGDCVETERCDLLDAWGRSDEKARQAWIVSGGRRDFLAELSAAGSCRQWLLPADMHLLGMEDKSYLPRLRWVSAVRLPQYGQSADPQDQEDCWQKRASISAEIELDLPRTCPGHPKESVILTALRDVLTMLCCARSLGMGYTQGLNFAAALLVSIIPRDDAFWCLAALTEHVGPHLFLGGTLQGVLVDCEVLEWLVEELSPRLASQFQSTAGYSAAFVYARPLCTLLAGCGLPAEATLQGWRALIHSISPRLLLLRLVAVFVCRIEGKIATLIKDGISTGYDANAIAECLQQGFQETFDLEPVLDAAARAAEDIPDSSLESKIQEVQGRMRRQAATERVRRSHLAVQRFSTGRGSHKQLIEQLQALWKGTTGEITKSEFVEILEAASTDHTGPPTPQSRTNLGLGGGVRSFTSEGSASSLLEDVFSDLDVRQDGRVPFKQALIALALLLGDRPQDRAASVFALLDTESRGKISQTDFENFGQLIGQEGAARARAMSDPGDGSRDDLDLHEFVRALLAFPSLAQKTFCTERDSPGANSFRLTAPQWMPDRRASSCISCAETFTCVRRRHHCRACGGIFCSMCSKHRLQLDMLGYGSRVRTCCGCYELLRLDA
eukprot:TRINITY_DN56750_c0_g1_i1.p1 TRINITY_DN56750_c0_g1~~TRINITY_DN56750_c0_g1_i1.p1  ORF type:complete len:672 (+),score=87.82 TRINITY_DN56750_c0_g1_i1:33-2018(+)